MGLAHSPDVDAVMNAFGDGDSSTTKRALTPEDAVFITRWSVDRDEAVLWVCGELGNA